MSRSVNSRRATKHSRRETKLQAELSATAFTHLSLFTSTKSSALRRRSAPLIPPVSTALNAAVLTLHDHCLPAALCSHLSLSGFLRSVLVGQTPRRFHTMSSFVVAFTLKHTPSSLVLANFPSGLPLASFSTVHHPRASCPPSPTSPSNRSYAVSRFKSGQQESRVLRDPRPNGMCWVEFDSPSFLRRTSNRSDHSLGRLSRSFCDFIALQAFQCAVLDDRPCSSPPRPHHTPQSCSSVRVRCPTSRRRQRIRVRFLEATP